METPAQGRMRAVQARRKRRKAEELWVAPDTRPKQRCYICRRECVMEVIRAPYRRKPFVCPWCRGRNIKFVWGCIRLTKQLAGRLCPRHAAPGHDPTACATAQCSARRIMAMRKSEREVKA
jgi:hypothetical protein